MSDEGIYKAPIIKAKLNNIDTYTLQMKVKNVVKIHYVAIRGKDKEVGAVQRVLSRQRVKSIKDYVLSGNIFFNTFILNWTEKNYKPVYSDTFIEIPIIPSSAQVIDGQHRIAGLQEAIEEDQSIGEKNILVTLCHDLSTEEAAEIFLNINTEQKPVPRSLIYDLFGLVEPDKQHAVNKAREIAEEFHKNPESPYYRNIKFPGKDTGFIDLSVVVSSIKKYLEADSVFFEYRITDLAVQKQILLNYFNVLKYFYDKRKFWNNKSKNPYLKGAGFIGAIDFFMEKLFIKCIGKRSFSFSTIKLLLDFEKTSLLVQSDLKGLDSKNARQKVKEYLESCLLTDTPSQEEYEL